MSQRPIENVKIEPYVLQSFESYPFNVDGEFVVVLCACGSEPVRIGADVCRSTPYVQYKKQNPNNQ